MIGTVFAVVIVFTILLVVSRSAGLFRRRMSVADSEEGSTAAVQRSAVLGAGAGVVVLFLLAVLYLGITQWQWLGRPSSHSVPAVISPVPVVSPAPLSGVSTSASPPAITASPSPTH